MQISGVEEEDRMMTSDDDGWSKNGVVQVRAKTATYKSESPLTK